MSAPGEGHPVTGPIGSRGPSMLWKDMGVVAVFVGFLVALLTFGGVDIVGSAIAPNERHAAVALGAALLGLAAGTAVVGVILAVRKAVLPEPAPQPRPQGKVEL
jgi:hypothetical protein